MRERIKEVRKKIGLTQAKFADRLAISTSYLAGMELGSKSINERTLRILCSEFGVDESWLRTGEGEMFSGETDAKILKVTTTFRALSPKLQAFALSMLGELFDLERELDKER